MRACLLLRTECKAQSNSPPVNRATQLYLRDILILKESVLHKLYEISRAVSFEALLKEQSHSAAVEATPAEDKTGPLKRPSDLLVPVRVTDDDTVTFDIHADKSQVEFVNLVSEDLIPEPAAAAEQQGCDVLCGGFSTEV